MLDFKRQNLAALLALKEPMGSLGAAVLREVMEPLISLTQSILGDRLAATVLTTALDGALSYAVYEKPAGLESPRARSSSGQRTAP